MKKYGYRFVGEDENGVWLHKGKRKAFSAAVYRDCKDDQSGPLGMPWLKIRLNESVPDGLFYFYANNRPAEAQEVAKMCGLGHLRGVEKYRE